jgi:circadian clock protein KaiC
MSKKSRTGSLDKLPTGVAGFDHLTGGGLPARRTALVLGGPGSGKTVFALQSLVASAQRGEPGIFVSFNEHPRHLVEHGSTFGWDLEAWEGQRLVFLNAGLRPTSVKPGLYDLTGMLAGLRAVASELNAQHIVFDSIDVLLKLLDEPRAELHELFRLRDWLFEHGISALITADVQGNEPTAIQRQAFLQAFADCAISLEFKTGHDASGRLRVLKYRGSPCLANEVPFVIGSNGIEVLSPRGAKGKRGAARSAATALGAEFEQARQTFATRAKDLKRLIEIKKAELEFLKNQKTSRPTRRPARAATRSTRSTRSAPKRSTPVPKNAAP